MRTHLTQLVSLRHCSRPVFSTGEHSFGYPFQCWKRSLSKACSCSVKHKYIRSRLHFPDSETRPAGCAQCSVVKFNANVIKNLPAIALDVLAKVNEGDHVWKSYLKVVWVWLWKLFRFFLWLVLLFTPPIDADETKLSYLVCNCVHTTNTDSSKLGRNETKLSCLVASAVWISH